MDYTPNYRAIKKASEFTKIVDFIIKRNEPFGFDIETGFWGEPTQDKIALKSMHPQWMLVGFSVSAATEEEAKNQSEWAMYVPIAHDDEEGKGINVDDPVQVARDLWRLLQTGLCVPHNASFELKGTGRWFRETLGDDPELGEAVTADFGIFPVLGDSQLIAFVADLWQGTKHKHKNVNVGQDLKSLVWHVFDHKMIEFGELFEEFNLKKQAYRRFNMLPLTEKVIRYACEDALWCLKLWRIAMRLVEEDKAEGNYSDTAYRIELALLPVVARMDQRGLPLDWNYMESKLHEAEELRQNMNEEILQEISEMLGDDVTNVNLGSPKQVAELLYDKLEIPPPMERGEVKRTTAEKPLQSIAKENKVVRDILTYRTVVKLIGSYLKKYLTDLNYRGDGKAYPSHNATGAISGRFSVDGMSYQQLPKPYYYKLKSGLEYHLAFREVIKAPEDSRIVGFDYSQIQLRMMAGFAQEKAMLSAFARGIDIHVATASSMLGVPEDQVTGKQRSIGKAQPLYEKVLTPTGWTTMGELEVGGEVIGSSGISTKITGIFPQKGKRPIYRVHTSDGGHVDMDEEHYLSVENKNNRGTWKKRTLREIMDAGIFEGSETQKYKQAKWRIPDRPVVEYAEYPELPIDPYFLGLLLGDGGFRGMSAVYYASSDPELQEYVKAVASRHEVDCVESSIRDYGTVTYNFVSRGHNTKNPLSYKLRELGLWGVKSSEKFIPEMYLRASPENRLALLQGLMDTDGSVSNSGASLRLNSYELIVGARDLARSLGGHASYRLEDSTEVTHTLPNGRGITTRLPTHATQITLPEGLLPFRLSRKVNKLKSRVRKNSNWIKKVEYVGEFDAQCISVDATDGLYISNGYNVISNTLNFSIVFGQGPDALANALTTPEEPVTKEDAAKKLRQYYEGFPALSAWMGGLQKTARLGHYVRGLFGRRYMIWEHESHLAGVRSKGDRTAVNEPIQGAEALYAKLAMVRAEDAIRKAGLQDKIQLVIMVHDALEFYVHNSISTQEVIDLLEPAVSFPIETIDPTFQGFPEIKSDWHEGPSLGALVEIDLDEAGKIEKYSMKMEVVGIDAVKWSGDTFEEVFSQYDKWRKTEHPEILNRKRAKDGLLEAVRAEVPQKVEEAVEPKKFEIRMDHGMTPTQSKNLAETLKSKEGPHSYIIVTPKGSAELKNFTSGVDLNDKNLISLQVGGATMNEVKELVDAMDDERHPF